MIYVEKATALLLYLFLFLFLYLGAWMVAHQKGRKKKTLPPLYQLQSCEYCAYAYLAETGREITTCPQCGSYNKLGVPSNINEKN